MSINISIKDSINGVTAALSFEISSEALMRELQVEELLHENLHNPVVDSNLLIQAVHLEVQTLIDRARKELLFGLVSSYTKLLSEKD